MSKYFLPLILLVSMVWTSCSNDFDLFTEKEEIPVVYALLSKSDEVHYIRLERAFLDENRSALLVASEPDSIYYKDATVELIDLVTQQVFEFQKTDLAQQDLPRDDGYFPSEPNYLYAIGAEEIDLQGNRNYRLEVKRNGELLTTSSVLIIDDLRIRSPVEGQGLNLQGEIRTNVRWDATAGAEFFNLRLYFNYEERIIDQGNTYEPRVAVWNVVTRASGNTIGIRGNEFLQWVGGALEEKGNVQRRFQSIDLRLDAGGLELFNYVNVGLANTGITSSNEIPLYTNIEGGLGVLSSINHTEVVDFHLRPAAMDSLIMGRFTQDLNFTR
nr:DUF4249 family protein [Saprospiraceae bacterium]